MSTATKRALRRSASWPSGLLIFDVAFQACVIILLEILPAIKVGYLLLLTIAAQPDPEQYRRIVDVWSISDLFDELRRINLIKGQQSRGASLSAPLLRRGNPQYAGELYAWQVDAYQRVLQAVETDT